MWHLANPTSDKPHGYKYSLVYIEKANARSATTTRTERVTTGISGFS